MKNRSLLSADRSQLDAFSELVLSIYEGPLKELGWRGFLQELCRHTESSSATLILHPPEENNPGILISFGLSSAQGKPSPYAREFFTTDPFVNLKPDTPVTLAEMVERDVLLASTFYQLCLEPQNIFHILGIDMYTESGIRANLRLMRPESDEAYDGKEKMFCSRLQPHIERALAISNMQSEVESELALYSGAVAQLEIGTLAIDELGTVIKSNAISDSMLRERDGIKLNANRLQLSDGGQNKVLKALLLEIKEAPENHQDMVRALRVPRIHSEAPLGLVLRPVSLQTWRSDGPVPVAMVFLRDPERVTSTPEDILRELFELTRMEAKVSMLLANGLTLDEIGETLNISRNTVRTHLRAVFPKTGVHHQNMLVKLVWRSVAQLGTRPV